MRDLTTHRQTVWEIVKESKDHPSAREVFDRAARRSSTLSFATVYNALRFLVEQGHLRQINLGGDAVRYDALLDRHDHFICRSCGKILDALGLNPADMHGALAAPDGFRVEEISLQISGRCGECAGMKTPAAA